MPNFKARVLKIVGKIKKGKPELIKKWPGWLAILGPPVRWETFWQRILIRKFLATESLSPMEAPVVTIAEELKEKSRFCVKKVLLNKKFFICSTLNLKRVEV